MNNEAGIPAPALVFEQVKMDNTVAVEDALAIYEQAFPLNERHTTAIIKERIQQGKNLLYTGRINNEIVLMALLWPLQGTHFILLDYMATHPAQQGKKIAERFLDHMKLFLQKHNQHFILEVEDPATGTNKAVRQKRIDFYRRHGAVQLKDISFTLPALQGTDHTDMLLMIFPAYANGTIEAVAVKKIIIQLYKELYNRDEAAALAGSSGYDKKMIVLI